MKRARVFFMAFTMAALGLGATGCNDDGRSLDEFRVSMATVDNPEESIYYNFTLDNGRRMWIAATEVYRYRPETGQRILANYTILSDRPAGSAYDHDVRLNSVYEVLTKDIIEITEANNAEIGDDPYRDVRMWVGGDWLNVEFTLLGYSRTHFINVGEDTRPGSEVPDDGTVYLELRHNAYNDLPSYTLWGLASFDLTPYRREGQTEVKLSVHANIFGLTEGETYELTYNYAAPSTPRVDIVMPREQAFIE